MSDQRPPRRNGDLLDSLEEFATGVGRLGFGLLRLPLGLLPAQSRTHMHNAIRELSYGFARLPGDFADIAGAEVERWAADEAAPAPQPPAPQPAPAPAPLGGTLDLSTLAPAPPAPTLDLSTLAPAPPAPTLDLSTLAPAPPIVTLEQSLLVPASPVTIAYIEFDPPGRDIDGEYVRIRNGSADSVDLTGWRLSDGDAKHSFTFPAFALAPGAEVQLWSKRGTNDAANLYWGNGRAIWNNTGDSATLTDAEGTVVGVYTYSGKG
jgi:hypothetical protein